MLPMDLIAEIMARLPVKTILRLRCVCKSWNALLSDPQFAKKQLQTSATAPTRHRIIVSHYGPTSYDPSTLNIMDFSLQSLLHSSKPTSSQLNLSYNVEGTIVGIRSCHGILCLSISGRTPLLWNPSTRKLKKLPPLEFPKNAGMINGFGYDYLSDTYKVVAFFISGDDVTHVMVHTLGTNYWRTLPQKFPSNNVLMGFESPELGTFL